MNPITQRILNSPPPGGRFIPYDESDLCRDVVQQQDCFQHTVDLDNKPADRDLRAGHVESINEDGNNGLRPHRFEASFSGHPWNGEMEWTRSFSPQNQPFVNAQVDFVEETHWHIAKGRVENLTVYYRPGQSSPAGADFMLLDPADPARSGITRWDADQLRDYF